MKKKTVKTRKEMFKTMFMTDRKWFHIGRKVPKGFKELPGGIHLGKGIWILKMEKDDAKD